MTDLDALLTGRQLVAALAEVGVGRWSADAVRQWTREEPACPIGERADQGKPHRYRLRDVLTWLRTRAQGERAKGFTRGDGDDLVSRLNAALLGASEPAILQPSNSVTGGRAAAAIQPSLPLESFASAPAPLSPAKESVGQTDWIALSDVDALIGVLQGRDPRNWKAAEEALSARRERLEAERRLIPVAELELALDLQTEHTRRGIAMAQPTLKLRLRDYLRPELLQEAERAIDALFAEILQRLAAIDDLEAPSMTAAAE